MEPRATIPFGDGALDLAVRTLAVDVVEGPDAGKQHRGTQERVTVGTAQGNDLELSDETVSRFHVELERTSDGVLVRDHASTNGTFVGTVRVHHAVVPTDTLLRIGKSAIRIHDGAESRVEVYHHDKLSGMSGSTAIMRRLMAQVQRAAATEAATLVVGESGTGKELVARALHETGGRRKGPFVTVDCGALSPNLVASELFGHERGAFTGADRQHRGAFERANGGTIFLDEIGELPAELQPTLLGALERRRFRRVGGHEDISVDVRVVAATHRDIRREVNGGAFRLDLYYRLAVVVLQVPALRDRRDDIPVLIRHFLHEAGEQGEIETLFSREFLESLRSYSFPGNVRELRNIVEATLAMGSAPSMETSLGDSQPPPVVAEATGSRYGHYVRGPYKEARAAVLHDFEVEYIDHWLDKSGGNVAKAAREAQMDRSHLFELLRRHGKK